MFPMKGSVPAQKVCTEMILNLVMSDSRLMEADNRPRELLDRLLYASAVI